MSSIVIRPEINEDDLPSPADLASTSLPIFMDNVMPMLMLGLAQTTVAFGAAMILVPLGMCAMGVVMFGSGAVAALAGSDASDVVQGLTALAVFGFYFLMLGLIIIGGAVITGPFMGSIMRGLDRHLAGEGEASFHDLYNTAKDQPLKDIGSTLLLSFAIMLGLPFCYVGALVPAFILMWFTWSCELDGLSLPNAIRRSVATVRAHPVWCLGVFALGFAFAFVGAYVPIVGPVAALMYYVRAYRAVFPRTPAAA
jgi:hypothetical protein